MPVSPDAQQDRDDAVYSRPFNGNPRLYRRVVVAAGLYLGLGVYLVYAFIRYCFAGDSRVFSLEALSYVGLFLLVYIPWSYRMMLRYDGLLTSGSTTASVTAASWLRAARHRLAARL